MLEKVPIAAAAKWHVKQCRRFELLGTVERVREQLGLSLCLCMRSTVQRGKNKNKMVLYPRARLLYVGLLAVTNDWRFPKDIGLLQFAGTKQLKYLCFCIENCNLFHQEYIYLCMSPAVFIHTQLPLAGVQAWKEQQ